tara:strand:+ start:80 stop:388 length:309 start_codon:yes stop_codon:yes gene_type:complete
MRLCNLSLLFHPRNRGSEADFVCNLTKTGLGLLCDPKLLWLGYAPKNSTLDGHKSEDTDMNAWLIPTITQTISGVLAMLIGMLLIRFYRKYRFRWPIERRNP